MRNSTIESSRFRAKSLIAGTLAMATVLASTIVVVGGAGASSPPASVSTNSPAVGGQRGHAESCGSPGTPTTYVTSTGYVTTYLTTVIPGQPTATYRVPGQPTTYATTPNTGSFHPTTFSTTPNAGSFNPTTYSTSTTPNAGSFNPTTYSTSSNAGSFSPTSYTTRPVPGSFRPTTFVTTIGFPSRNVQKAIVTAVVVVKVKQTGTPPTGDCPVELSVGPTPPSVVGQFGYTIPVSTNDGPGLSYLSLTPAVCRVGTTTGVVAFLKTGDCKVRVVVAATTGFTGRKSHDIKIAVNAVPTKLLVKCFFDNDSSVLKPACLSQLRELVKVVRNLHLKRLVVNGYASTPGTPISNGPLSVARAEAVAAALRTLFRSSGLTGVTVVTTGYGATGVRQRVAQIFG